MGYAVRMPQLGMTMEEGVVVEWCYEEDESFEEGDVIAVVESEKTTNDVEAREDGTFVEQFVDPEEPVEPGAPIAYVGDPGDKVPEDVRVELDNDGSGLEVGESEAQATTTASVGDPAGVAGSSGGGAVAAKVSPRARSFARSNDLPEDELASLEGSGPSGAVVEADVVEAENAGRLGESRGELGTSVEGETAVEGRGVYDRREGSRLRQAVADRMTLSAREAPQVTLNRRVSVGPLLNLKERLAQDRELDLSLSDFVLAAVAETMEEHPEFNAIYEDGVHKLARNVNIGVAVDSEDGLLTPVVKGAGQRTLSELAVERSRLVETVLAGEHTYDDLAEGTFTVTNLGHFGVETFDPIINPPQVAILGVGAVTEEYDPERGESRPQLALSLTFDHRPVDGADSARFLDALADALTHPTRLLTLTDDVDGGESPATNEDAATPGSFAELDSPATEERAAAAASEDGMLATVRSRDFEWYADEPEDVGGDDTAPNPVEQFLGSLASCLSLMFRNMADRRDVPVDSIEVDVNASPKEGRIERLDVAVAVVSGADEDEVERVLQTAERACFVNQVVDDDIERSVSLTVQNPPNR